MQEDAAQHTTEGEQRILLAMPAGPVQEVLTDYLRRRGFVVFSAWEPPAALALLGEGRWDGVIVDSLLGSTASRIAAEASQLQPGARLVMLTPQGARLRWAVPGLEAVAHPFRPSQLAARLGAWDGLRLAAG